ncbi:ATP-dependent helicase [Alteromonas macleodii]|uniref:ATP-dependent helicase n=1 Tax=Alteromonas macleodii TaxID=28108 RepID=UPI003140A86E
MSLNPKQQIVADAKTYALTCALPGSGKTHTSMELVKNLLEPKENYAVMVTFTRAGAGEMRERIEKKLTSEQQKRVRVSTFHSLFISMYKAAGGYKKIIMGADQDNIIRMAIKSVDAALLDDYMDVVQSIDLLGRQLDPDMGAVPALHAEVFRKYQNLCRKYNKTDLNALSREVVIKLQNNEMKPLNCTHMIVDEFQDSDEVQVEFLLLHGRAGVIVMTVGDDDQAIYSWRGAMGYTGMVKFLDEFKIKAFVLDTCYRCAEEVLMSAKELVENNVYRVAKTMKSAAGDGGSVYVYETNDLEHEVDTIIKHIPSQKGQWAVLSRNQIQLDAVQTALQEHGFSYRRLGEKSIFENKDVNALMTMMASIKYDKNKHNIIDTLMFMEEPEDSMDIIVNTLVTKKQSLAHIAQSEFLDCSAELMNLSRLWPDLKYDTTNPSEIDRRCRELKNVIFRAKGVTADKGGKMFEAFFKMFTRWANKGGWTDAVEKTAYLLNNKDDSEKKEVEVELSTLHSSKGLEWPNVWIMGVNDSNIPGENINEATLEEERRLLYVGMTRAEKNLRLSYHKEKASCFIGELTHECIKFKRAAPSK